MIPFERIYLDANIFIYLFEGNDARADRLRSMLLSPQTPGKPIFTTSELTLAESLVGAYRKADENLIRLYDNWTISNAQLEVGPIDRSVLWRSAILRANYRTLKLPDAIHLSTAFAFGCSHVLSGDERLGSEVAFVDPRPWLGNPPRTLQIVKPEEQVLEAISGAI